MESRRTQMLQGSAGCDGRSPPFGRQCPARPLHLILQAHPLGAESALSIMTELRMTQSTLRPDYKEFSRLAQSATLVPVVKSVAADLLTPVSAFLAIAANEPDAFLLESVERGEQIGRYTFLGARPYMQVRARGGDIEVLARQEEGKARRAARFRSSRNCCGSIVRRQCPDCRRSPRARWATSLTTRCGNWKILASMPRMIFLCPIAS